MDYYFTFSNMTSAQSAKAALERTGIGAAVRRTSGQMAESGCGYLLQVSTGNGRWASSVMRRNGASYRKVYQKDAFGAYREVRL